MIAIAKYRLPVAVRPMTKRDLPDVLAIERQCYLAPWCQHYFKTYIRNRCGFAAHYDNRVVGYLAYDKDEIQKQHLHLVNCAVAPTCWERGIGTKLLKKMKGMLAEGGWTRITAPVRERDLRAQLFLQSQGFRFLTMWPRYFIKPIEDAYLLQYRLGGPIDSQASWIDCLKCR